eukprot:gene37918-61315_t
MARLGTVQAQIESASVRNESEASALHLARAELVEADPYETALRLQEAESQLEKIFTITPCGFPKMIKGLICCFCLGFPTLAVAEIRIKDLVEFDGVRGNDLVGYGLVVGLNGTGDGLRNAPFTEEIMSNLLERLGVNVAGENYSPKNVAAVFVTASLPAFARAGGQIDVTVSAIGDAKSLL